MLLARYNTILQCSVSFKHHVINLCKDTHSCNIIQTGLLFLKEIHKTAQCIQPFYGMAIIQSTCVSRHLAPAKNWRVLLEQNFTAHMPLLMATGTIILGRRCERSPPGCYIHHLVLAQNKYMQQCTTMNISILTVIFQGNLC